MNKNNKDSENLNQEDNEHNNNLDGEKKIDSDNLSEKKTKKKVEKVKKNPSNSSKNIDNFLGDPLKELDNKEILDDNTLLKDEELKSQFKTNTKLIKEEEDFLEKKSLTKYVSDLLTKWRSTILEIIKLKKDTLNDYDNLLIENIESNQEKILTIPDEIKEKKSKIKEEGISIDFIKNHPLLKELYQSSIYKNLKDKQRPPESYIRHIVQLISFHSEKEILSQYYIKVENFNSNDFIRYATDLGSIQELINLRDQEQLLLPAPMAAQIVEKGLRVTLNPNESLAEIYDKINLEQARILKYDYEFDDFKKFNDENKEFELKNLESYNAPEEEEEEENKGLFSFDFMNFFGEIGKKFGEAIELESNLEKFGTNMTDLAKSGVLDTCFGREKELSLLMEILLRRQKNNAVLIGEAGVGKTAIVELFASKLVEDNVPFILMGREIVSLDLTRMVGGSRYRGDFEQRLQQVVDEVFEKPNIIIFIDEIHNITGAGSAEGSMDAANILKPILSRSGFQCIGATTVKEYQRIEKDAALNRRFQAITVNEPTVEDTINILYGLRPTIEMYHNIEITPAAFHSATELSHRYIIDKFLPDKALDLVDRAAARLVLRLTSKEYSSVISALINSALRQIGKIKLESFRRGDIASEFIFQEVENAYRNLLITWLENYKDIPFTRSQFKDEKTQNLLVNSPITKGIYDLMQKTILGRVDELLFTNQKPKLVIEKELKEENFSKEHNLKIYKRIFKTNNLELSLYRCSLVLFLEWLFNIDLPTKKNTSLTLDIFENKQLGFDDLVGSYISIGAVTHLQLLREISLENESLKSFSTTFYTPISDFIKKDGEKYSQEFYELDELENNRIEIFEDFLVKLNPLVKDGIIESNSITGDLDIDSKDINRIYKLLGYFSTSTGKSFLQTFNEPEILKEARRHNNISSLKNRIGEEEIQKLFCEITGIPIESLTEKDTTKLLNLEKDLKERVVGQEEAISAITKAVQRSRMGIQNPNRPIASFLFCGPTGVGKTEVTKALAACLFGSEKDMIRLDMSEFMEKFAVSRLIGSPPGYVGYEDGGQLTDAVRRRPYSVVLFDELEKAHADVLNILLQILEDGRLTDSQKRLVGFENTVIIMTSNAAASEIQLLLKDFETLQMKKDALDQSKNEKETEQKTSYKYKDDYAGVIEFFHSPIKDEYFADIHEELSKVYKRSFLNVKPLNLYETYLKNSDRKEQTQEQKDQEKNNLQEQEIQQLEINLKNRVLETLSTLFLPEFLNRLDDIIIFQPLKPKDIRRICDILLKSLIARVKDRGFELVVDTSARGLLAAKGYNPKYGARPLRRLITKTVEDLVSETLLNSPDLTPNSILKIELDEKESFICRTFSKND